MSFTTTNPKNEKKTALKLINKYADSYNVIIQENKTLKTEIKDLRANLKINKEIIECFFSQKQPKEKTQICISKFKEESQKLYSQNEQLNKEIQNLHSKIAYNEQTFSELLNRENEVCEKLKTQIFILEQTNKKKDSVIALQKRKIDSHKDDDFSFIEKEIYVLEPSQAIIQINDELLLYKQIYENLTSHIKDTRESVQRYEAMITELQNENLKLRAQYKMHILSANRERETLISAINREKNSNSNTRTVTENGSKSFTKIKNLGLFPEEKLFMKLKLEDKSTKFENEDFVEILKAVGLSQHEFDKMAKMKVHSKLTDTIEMMYRLLKDKTMTMNLLDKENENLTAKNFKLNKENIRLFQENIDLKQELKKNLNLSTTTKKTDLSLINNTSKITVNQGVENTINTYKKFIKSRIDENDIEARKEIEDSNTIEGENSGHDSIIYTKNIKEDSEILDESNGKGKDSRSIKQNNSRRDMTLESITSSEFRQGVKVESFMSTIRGTNNSIIDSKNDAKNEEDSSELEVYNIKTPKI